MDNVHHPAVLRDRESATETILANAERW